MSNLYQTTLGEHPISLETGKLAGQAGGAVTIRSGDTVLLATATAAKEPREGLTFFPLTVDYEERLYAAGKIPGGFFKREGRPSEQAILLCRLTDRALRPLFPQNLRHEVQVILTALSADQENYLDVLALIGASAAVSISDIPFKGPMSAVRMGLIDGRLVINPTASQMASSILDLRLAGTRETVLMIEAEGKEIGEAQIWEAVRLGHQAMQNVIGVQERMMAEVGKPKREALTYFRLPAEVRQVIQQRAGGLPTQILTAAMGKEERNRALDNLHTQLLTELPSLGELFTSEAIEAAWEELLRQEFRALVLSRGLRPDGRRPQEIRPLSSEAGMLPRTHGSGLFTRGETQVLTIATLGTASDEQILDGLTPLESKRFMHHYNFPPYSTGETRPLRGPGRREIGHGALAERALAQVIPSEEAFPYTLRLVSEVLSSNGSTSMASVCGSSLALMDAGVPLAAHVAGISIGLVKGDEGFALLTDIQGVEDALGDMDFKVAGTRQGITAIQLDLKLEQLEPTILEQALVRAREARLVILDKMEEAIARPRPELSPHAPRITLLKIDPEKIGLVIGPGGKTIRKIIEETGVKIDVEDDGTIFIASTDGASRDRAVEFIRALTEEPEIGKIYTGKVRRVTDFGAFVEILPGRDGLVHVSQLADYRVPKASDVVKVGDEIMVMVIAIDEDDKIRLSRQAVLEGWTAEKAREMDRKPSRPSRTPGGARRPPRRSGPPPRGSRGRGDQ